MWQKIDVWIIKISPSINLQYHITCFMQAATLLIKFFSNIKNYFMLHCVSWDLCIWRKKQCIQKIYSRFDSEHPECKEAQALAHKQKGTKFPLLFCIIHALYFALSKTGKASLDFIPPSRQSLMHQKYWRIFNKSTLILILWLLLAKIITFDFNSNLSKIDTCFDKRL